MDTQIKNIILLIKEAGFKVKPLKMYGVWILEFEHTGIQVRELKRFIEFLPKGATLTTSNGCFAINTRISI